jgi:hypothetical protein
MITRAQETIIFIKDLSSPEGLCRGKGEYRGLDIKRECAKFIKIYRVIMPTSMKG